VSPAHLPIVKAGSGPNDIVRNTRQSNSSQRSVTNAGSSEKLQPIDIREGPKTGPRNISTIPISSKPSDGAVAPAPAATAPALDPVVASSLDQHALPSVPPPASAPLPALASSEPEDIHRILVGPGETNTSSPPALAPNRATLAAERLRAAAAPPVGTQGDATPPQSSRSPIGSGNAVKVFSGGGYAVQVASERSTAAPPIAAAPPACSGPGGTV
jgi:hypothetical protein